MIRNLYLTLVCFFAITFSHAQCNTYVTLTSQADVDSFSTVYGCTSVAWLTITGDDITNLDGLSGLTLIYSLRIENNPVLTNINGLSNVTEIRDNGVMGEITAVISGNPMLTSLAPLANGLNGDVGYIGVIDNDALTDLAGLQNILSVGGGGLDISGNASLTNISALSSIRKVYLQLNISDNASLPNLNGLQSLTGIEIQHGGGVMLNVSNNASLTDVDSLSSLRDFSGPGQKVTMTNNPNLTRGCGLFPLISLKESECPGCIPYDFSGSGISKEGILANGPCPKTWDGNITLTTQAEVDAFPAAYGATVITGTLEVNGTDIRFLRSLSTVTSAYKLIIRNTSVGDLHGLENLKTMTSGFCGCVENGLIIDSNSQLVNIDALSSLGSVDQGGMVQVMNNPLLTDLDGLSSLTSIGINNSGGKQSIHVEGNPALTSIEGLRNVTTITGGVNIINNDALTNLDGLNQLTTIGGLGLRIRENQLLTSLGALSKVSYIENSFDITDNASLPNLNGF